MRDVIVEANAELSVTEVLCEAAEESVNSRIVVFGSGGIARVTTDLIEELTAEWDTERDYFGNTRPKRVGLVAGMVHMATRSTGLTCGRGYPMSFYAEPATYFDYWTSIRDEQTAHSIRRPPKCATCSSRRRGRKFKG